MIMLLILDIEWPDHIQYPSNENKETVMSVAFASFEMGLDIFMIFILKHFQMSKINN